MSRLPFAPRVRSTPRTYLNVTLAYGSTIPRPSGLVPLRERATTLVRDGFLYGKPRKMAYVLKPPVSRDGVLALGDPAPGQHPATFLRDDGGMTFPRIDPVRHEPGRRLALLTNRVDRGLPARRPEADHRKVAR